MKTLVITLAIAFASAAGFAQCQSSRIALSQELHDAGTTMVATVSDASPMPETDARVSGVDYVVHVDRVLKGHMISTATVHIFSENGAAKFPMQTGKQYLLFVHRDNDSFQVDNCGNSGLLQASNIDSAARLKQIAQN